LGWTRGMSREEYERRVADGSLGDVLRHVSAEPGDVFFLPAGTVHAIGAGIVLFEAQQTSDLTYRIFDWNRVDASGKTRELNVSKAGDVLNYERGTRNEIDVLAYGVDGSTRMALVAGASIELERVVVDAGTSAPFSTEGVPVAVMPLMQPLEIAYGAGDSLQVQPYETVLLPASIAGVSFGARAVTGSVLAASPPSGKLRERLERAGIEPGRISNFLAQF
jgi:mannose-6-phosphate isomerase